MLLETAPVLIGLLIERNVMPFMYLFHAPQIVCSVCAGEYTLFGRIRNRVEPEKDKEESGRKEKGPYLSVYSDDFRRTLMIGDGDMPKGRLVYLHPHAID